MKNLRKLFMVAGLFLIAGISKGQTVDTLKQTYNEKGDTVLTIVQTTIQTFTFPKVDVIVVVKPKTGVVNQAPIVNAGSAQTITLPVNSVTLSATASDKDGTVAAYLWSQVSGLPATLLTPANASTLVSVTQAGIYTFKITATDNEGATATSNVMVTVNAQPAVGYTLIYTNLADRVIGKSGDGQNNLGDLDPFDHGQYGKGYIDLSNYKTGPGAFHSRPNNVSSGIRSEIQFDAAQTPLEGAVEYDVLYNVIVPNNGHSLQWHPSTSDGSASPGLWFSGGKFLWNNWINGVNQGHSTGITVQTGHWYHMRIEYKFGSAGYLRHYLDGTLVCSWTGQVGDGSTPYFKWGYNGWDSNSPASDIIYDNLQIFKKQ